jgi:hypothetical protein
MNTYEVAVLRILIKRQQPLKLSSLISGFPDDSEDSVLSAVSSLRLDGYIALNDYQPNGYVSVNRERRKEILQIVSPDIKSDELEDLRTKKNPHNSVSFEKRPFGHIITTYPISQTIKTIAISSILIFGFVFALGSSMPTTSPDTESIAYYPHMPYKEWAGSAYGANHHNDFNSPASSYAPAPATSVALKDCDQKLSQQQT